MRESVRKAIATALRGGTAFYAYKSAENSDFVFGAQVNEDFRSDTGFKIVPFTESDLFPTRIIYREYNENNLPEAVSDKCMPKVTRQSTTEADYLAGAEDCIKELRNRSDLLKVVYSRTIVRNFSTDDWGAVLELLAATNPAAFIFIYYSPETGCWAGASPETLGKYADGTFSTMALAGTRRKGGAPWTDKEVEEQEYVVYYIGETISSTGLDYEMSEKFTASAGCVEHLCNSFRVKTDDRKAAEELVARLHPTPALAGIPKAAALAAIERHEGHQREYYGGYIGPFDSERFDYKVNLRSMKFDGEKIQLFVGGGLTAKSSAAAEYAETSAKAQTILDSL